MTNLVVPLLVDLTLMVEFVLADSEVIITVGHRPFADQINNIATHFLVLSDIFQIKED